MPKIEKSTMVSAYDGLKLSLLTVLPDCDPVGILQLSHGMCEHKERYVPFMEFMAENGLVCVINDHRGHGESIRQDDDLGYFYKDGAAALVSDLHQITMSMRKQYPDRKLILFGHSMGSLAVRCYADIYDSDIDGLIVCGSPGANPGAGMGLLLIRVMRLFAGERHRSKLLQGMTTGGFAKRFPDPDHPSAWLSVNKENVDAYEKDPLCGFNFTLNGNEALLKLMQGAYAFRAERKNPALSVRFYSGADDPCAPDRKGFDNAVEVMRKAGFQNVAGHMFDGMRHEILNETDRVSVYRRMYDEAIAPVIGGK